MEKENRFRLFPKCAERIEAYSKLRPDVLAYTDLENCVRANPDDSATKCYKERKAMSECSADQSEPLMPIAKFSVRPL